MSVAAALAQYRADHSVTRKVVAELIGIAESYLREIEVGHKRLPDHWIKTLAPGPLRDALVKARQAEYTAMGEGLDPA